MPSHTQSERSKNSGSKSTTGMAPQVKQGGNKAAHKDMKPKDKSGFTRGK